MEFSKGLVGEKMGVKVKQIKPGGPPHQKVREARLV